MQNCKHNKDLKEKPETLQMFQYLALGASRVGFTPLVVSWKKRGQLRSQAKYKRVMNHFSKSMDETETETSSTDTEDLEVDFV